MPEWTVDFASAQVEADIVARFLRFAERMQKWGPDLGMPHTRAMGRGLFELRVQAAEGIARLFYCPAPGRRIVFVHSFVKKTGKTPAGVLDLARRRMRQVADG
jgi:phage-related protein